MKRLSRVAAGLSLALGLSLGVACAGEEALPAPPSDRPAAEVQVEAELERLRALDVFEVGELVLDLPAEAFTCYVCPGGVHPDWADEAAAETERQALRLAALADAAEAAAAGADPASAPDFTVANQELRAIAALEIVGVGELIQEQPVAEPNCYNLPCPGEEERVAAANAERRAKAVAIARAARGL